MNGQNRLVYLVRRMVLRFFSDGSANASREFILRFRKLQRRFAVSPLTGLLLAKEEEAVL